MSVQPMDSNSSHSDLFEWYQSKNIAISPSIALCSWDLPSSPSSSSEVPSIIQHRGFRAIQHIPAGELLFRLPCESCFGPHLIKQDPLLSLFARRFPHTPDSLLLALLLVLLKRREQSNPGSTGWGPFVLALPTNYDLPLFMNDNELSFLTASTCGLDSMNAGWLHELHEFAAQFDAFREQYDKKKPPASSICNRSNPFGGLGDAPMSVDDLKWASASVHSRAFDVQATADVGSRVRLILTGIDMINHAHDKSMPRPLLQVEDKAFELRATVDIQQGDEVFISYGDKSNSDLLLFYGFTVPENRFDTAQLDLPLIRRIHKLSEYPLEAEEEAEQPTSLKDKILSKLTLPLDPSGFVILMDSEKTISNLVTHLAVEMCAQEVLSKFEEHVERGEEAEADPAVAKLLRNAKDAISSLMKPQISTLKTQIKRLEATIAESDAHNNNYRLGCMLDLLNGELRVLEVCAKYLE